MRSFGGPQASSRRAICFARASGVKRFPTLAINAEALGDSCEVSARVVIDRPTRPKLSVAIEHLLRFACEDAGGVGPRIGYGFRLGGFECVEHVRRFVGLAELADEPARCVFVLARAHQERDRVPPQVANRISGNRGSVHYLGFADLLGEAGVRVLVLVVVGLERRLVLGHSAEQLALLPARPSETAAEAVASGERRIGRPPGARNRRTQDMVRWLLDVRGLKPPLEFLLEVTGKTTAELVDMGVKAEEALKLKVHAAVAALPYVHQKQPMAVEAVGKTAGLLVLPGEGGTAEEQAADMGFDLEILPNGNVMVSQQLSDDDWAQSDAPQSDAEPK